jgi:hypothetical protein
MWFGRLPDDGGETKHRLLGKKVIQQLSFWKSRESEKGTKLIKIEKKGTGTL